MGKVLPEARGDVQEAIDMAYYMGGEGRRLFGQTTPSELRDKFNMSVRHADRCRRRDHAVELPDRHPLLEDPARARLREHGRLQAGDRHAVPRRALRGAAREAGVPAGVVNVVHGGGGEVGNAIVEHPDVPVITLTGSRETGVAGHEGPAPTGSSTSTSSSAARTRSSCWTTPISTWPSRASSGRRSAPRASAARPRAA